MPFTSNHCGGIDLYFTTAPFCSCLPVDKVSIYFQTLQNCQHLLTAFQYYPFTNFPPSLGQCNTPFPYHFHCIVHPADAEDGPFGPSIPPKKHILQPLAGTGECSSIHHADQTALVIKEEEDDDKEERKSPPKPIQQFRTDLVCSSNP